MSLLKRLFNKQEEQLNQTIAKDDEIIMWLKTHVIVTDILLDLEAEGNTLTKGIIKDVLADGEFKDIPFSSNDLLRVWNTVKCGF